MNKILILGKGGHSKVIEDTLLACNEFNEVAFLDDKVHNQNSREVSSDRNLIGSLNAIYNPEIKSKYNFGFVAICDPQIRLKWIQELVGNGYTVPVIIHPTAWVSKSAILGAGSVVLSQASIQANVTCGIGTIVNNSASIDHESILGKGVHICPGVNIAGNVEIGEKAFIGIGSSIIQGLKVGSNTIVGANAAVVKNLPDSVTAVGVPAKVIKSTNL